VWSRVEDDVRFIKDNVDIWVFVNNSGDEYEVIAESYFSIETVFWQEIWIELNSRYNEY
jgi:hypothetical protein